MKRSIAVMLSVVVLILGMAPVADADNAAAVKSRMAKRLNQIVSLKQSGTIGENNLGYLTIRRSLSSSQQAIVNAENNDRKAVYGMIAAKTSSSISSVGKTRAGSIRKSAPKGTWVQLSNGSWKQR